MRLVVASLKAHRTDVPTVRASFKALTRLALNADVRDKLAKDGIVNEIVEAMQLNPNEGPLLRQAVVFLLQLVRMHVRSALGSRILG